MLKAALKQRIYKRDDIEVGDWIYFKNDKKWQGLIEVTTKDGKKLYAVRAGSLLTINSDHAVIAKSGEEFEPAPIESNVLSSQPTVMS